MNFIYTSLKFLLFPTGVKCYLENDVSRKKIDANLSLCYGDGKPSLTPRISVGSVEEDTNMQVSGKCLKSLYEDRGKREKMTLVLTMIAYKWVTPTPWLELFSAIANILWRNIEEVRSLGDRSYSLSPKSMRPQFSAWGWLRPNRKSLEDLVYSMWKPLLILSVTISRSDGDKEIPERNEKNLKTLVKKQSKNTCNKHGIYIYSHLHQLYHHQR